MQQIYRRTPMPKCDFNKVDFINFRKNFHHEQLRMFHKKNKLRTFWDWKLWKNKNIERSQNFTDSYQKSVIEKILNMSLLCWQFNCCLSLGALLIVWKLYWTVMIKISRKTMFLYHENLFIIWKFKSVTG